MGYLLRGFFKLEMWLVGFAAELREAAEVGSNWGAKSGGGEHLMFMGPGRTTEDMTLDCWLNNSAAAAASAADCACPN